MTRIDDLPTGDFAELIRGRESGVRDRHVGTRSQRDDRDHP